MVLHNQKRDLCHTPRVHDQQHRRPCQNLLCRQPRGYVALNGNSKRKDRCCKAPCLDFLPPDDADNDDGDMDQEDQGGVDVGEKSTTGVGANIGGAIEGMNREG